MTQSKRLAAVLLLWTILLSGTHEADAAGFLRVQGQDSAGQFWLKFRKNYITETDIKRIAELGFNSVRPALNARHFLTEGENPVYVDEGFELLDNLIRWCKKYGVYAIIDMHGAPGGQTGANIDDSPNDQPDRLKSIEPFLAKREEWNRPVWVGETGEKNNTMYWGTTQYFEANNIGWAFWPWKKMNTKNTPYSIDKPEGWDEITAYSRGEGKPSRELAQKAFDELLENVKIENCVPFPDHTSDWAKANGRPTKSTAWDHEPAMRS